MAWANETEPLTFLVPSGAHSNWELDDMAFSISAVPEPDPFLLTRIGGLAFAEYRRCRRL